MATQDIHLLYPLTLDFNLFSFNHPSVDVCVKMAKKNVVCVWLWNEETGDHYTIKKNQKKHPTKMTRKKYSKTAKKVLTFIEKKITYQKK